MKILNLYAGLGGNRMYWQDCAVTAVEYTDKIANAYKKQYPQDTVIVTDAHQYLLENFQDFDFIWSSPPCQSHSRMIRSGKNRKPRFIDLKLYEEILLLQADFKGKWIVENVVPYYKPLIAPSKKVGRHLFWSNFEFQAEDVPSPKGFINQTTLRGAEALKEWLGIAYEGSIYYEGNHCPAQVLRNAVHPEIGRQIMKSLKGAE
jgi:DNA (cytosine-5)-methyltransferase 1